MCLIANAANSMQKAQYNPCSQVGDAYLREQTTISIKLALIESRSSIFNQCGRSNHQNFKERSLYVAAELLTLWGIISSNVFNEQVEQHAGTGRAFYWLMSHQASSYRHPGFRHQLKQFVRVSFRIFIKGGGGGKDYSIFSKHEKRNCAH